MERRGGSDSFEGWPGWLRRQLRPWTLLVQFHGSPGTRSSTGATHARIQARPNQSATRRSPSRRASLPQPVPAADPMSSESVAPALASSCKAVAHIGRQRRDGAGSVVQAVGEGVGERARQYPAQHDWCGRQLACFRAPSSCPCRRAGAWARCWALLRLLSRIGRPWPCCAADRGPRTWQRGIPAGLFPYLITTISFALGWVLAADAMTRPGDPSIWRQIVSGRSNKTGVGGFSYLQMAQRGHDATLPWHIVFGLCARWRSAGRSGDGWGRVVFHHARKT